MTVSGPATSGDAASVSGVTVDSQAALVDLLGRISSDLSHLVRAELELAKVEIKDEVTRSAAAAGLLGGTVFSGYFVLLMLSFAAAFGLAEIMAAGWAFLVVAFAYAVAAGALFMWSRKKMATVSLVPRKTIRTLSEDLSWLKQQWN